jgi:hypothetical protein
MTLLAAPAAWGVPFGGIEFPDGERSFADAVLRFDSPPTGILRRH